jgi:hypothetical protein
MRILFAKIGWMVHYQGYTAKDKIVGGGSYRNDKKHETFNFQNLKGKYYGYVQPSHDKIRLYKIDEKCSEEQTRLSDVLVVWLAKRPTVGGVYVVGWYKNATVYSEFQSSKCAERNYYTYNIVAKSSDGVLLPVDQRFEAPKGCFYRNVRFDNPEDKVLSSFRNKVVRYIENYSADKKYVSKHAIQVNVEARKQVEEAAVDYVIKQYEAQGYKVKSRERENLGWDLDAWQGKIKLKLEVKGLAQSTISVHITQNEHSEMMADKDNYRLCVVINAVKAPQLIVFLWDESQKAWVSEDDTSIALTIDMKPSYIASVE